jgi:hypothetical protein
MLEEIAASRHDEALHRFALPWGAMDALRALGLDEEDLEAAFELLAGHERSRPQAFLDAPFALRSSALRPGFRQRFSDDSLRAFYSALEAETAVAEVVHHARVEARPGGEEPRRLHYAHLTCRFQGEAIDLRPEAGRWTHAYPVDARSGLRTVRRRSPFGKQAC